MSAMKGGCWAAYVISWRATRNMDLSPLLPCDKPNGHALVIAHDHLGIGPEEDPGRLAVGVRRSEEHTSELQSLMRISYAVFCLQKQTSCRMSFIIRALYNTLSAFLMEAYNN